MWYIYIYIYIYIIYIYIYIYISHLCSLVYDGVMGNSAVMVWEITQNEQKM